MRGRVALGLAGVMVYALCAAPAGAGLWGELYRGLELVATPSGSPLSTLGDGSRVNGARLGRLRIMPNDFGDGHRLEFDRTFGRDSRGRPEILDLGQFEVELAGATQMTASYTDRWLLTGNMEFVASDLNYRTAVKSGALDAQLTGTLDVANALEINQLGFYTIQINISNDNSELVVDTLSDSTNEELDFDIGPITLQGNVFVDLFISFMGAIGVDTTELSRLSPQSPADAVSAALADAWQRQALVAGYTISADADGTLVFDPIDSLGTDVAPIVESARLVSDAPARYGLVTPEPSAIVLLLLGTLFLRRR